MNLGLTLTQTALKRPDKTALVFEGRRWTYGQWNRDVNRAANAFAARGISRGDRVAFLTWNLPEQVTGIYGLLKIGAVPVPINYRLAPNEIAYIINDCAARLLVFEEALRDPVMAVRDDLTTIEELIYIGGTPEHGETPFECFVAPASDREPGVGAGPRGCGVHYVHLRHHRIAERRRANPCRGVVRRRDNGPGMRFRP